MTLIPRYLRHRRPTRKPEPPAWPPLPPGPHLVTYVSVEQELPGMEGIERVPLPFAKQQPRYRIDLTIRVEGSAEFTTWDDPEKWGEDDDNANDLIDQAVNWGQDYTTVETWGRLTQLQEDGSWGEVDWDSIHAREEENDGD